MSPTDAKRGAKRRKNKRGGGSSCSSTVSSSSGKAGALATARSSQAAGTPSSVMGLLSAGSTGNGNPGGIAGLNGEVSVNGTQFSEGPVNADFTGVMQSPFTFGLGQRAPYSSGERCLLCRSERKEASLLDAGLPGSNAATLSPAAKINSVLQLPLWVCPDCRRTVEKEERHAALGQSLGDQDFLLHMPMGGGTLAQEPGGPQILPAPDPSAAPPADTPCSCEACSERRDISAESERESQQLQNYWSEVRYLVRCIYRQTGTPLADDHDQPLERDKDGMKELVDRLCEKDPYQLYQRLEQQAREYVLETKVRLLKHLSAGSKGASAVQGPPQAHQFISLLLEEYSALCQAARTISTFLLTLEREHLHKFQVTWELHNKHLFENLVFSEPILHNSLPALVSQLRHGTASRDSYSEDMYRALLERYHELDQEMNVVAVEWLECEKRIDDYVDEQLLFKVEGQNHTNQRTEPHKSLVSKNMSLKTKQRMLKEDWEFFKQRRFIEEQLTNSKKSLAADSNFTDTMRQMLSSRLSIPDCPNCNYRRRCTCDDCSLSHILTCGIIDSPIADDDDLHVKLPLQAEPRPPSMSSASSASGSGSGSSSPIISVQQHHPRLLLADHGPDPTFSDDDEVPQLSAKFADIYTLSGYEDAEVAAGMNGVHADLNGGGENMALKDESPRESSSSSSEADDDEADGESGREPPGPQGALSLRNRTSSKHLRTDSPPPSYPHPQVQNGAAQVAHACECHVCSQELVAPPPSRPHSAHQFFAEKTPHPALHLYPHIHGHPPLHNPLSHLPRPLLHPTLYSSPPLTHGKTLLSAPTSNHTGGKRQAFSPPLQEHVLQSCLGSGGADWNSSLHCPSLKFENIWDTNVMKSWNPAVFLQEPLPGDQHPGDDDDDDIHCDSYSLSDILGPALPEVALPSPGSDPSVPPDAKEKKNTAKKKCLYNFQDAFMEANKAAMATSSAASPVSCTATTVQSSNNPIRSSKRAASLGEVFHNMGKEDHRHLAPIAPRNSPTGLASLPPLPAPALPPVPTAHLPGMGPQPYPKTALAAPGFLDAHHQGACLSSADIAPVEGPASAPPSVCSDPDCEGHRCEGNGAYDHRHYDGEESQDDDSCSEHSSSTSTSTNQKEGKYCDCCYCEFFGHGGLCGPAVTMAKRCLLRDSTRPRAVDSSDVETTGPRGRPPPLLFNAVLFGASRAPVWSRTRSEKRTLFVVSPGVAPAAPTSRNYAEMREKLRLRLTKRKEEQPKKDDPLLERDDVEDHRKVEDLLQFINSADSKPTSSSKAAKRARHKQKKMEEKARAEAEAREREEEQRQREAEEEALKQELLRLQELQQLRAAKKKRKERAREAHRPPPHPAAPEGRAPHREPGGKPRAKQPAARLVAEAPRRPAHVHRGPEPGPKAADVTQAEPRARPRPADDLPVEPRREEKACAVAGGRRQLNHVRVERPPHPEPRPQPEPEPQPEVAPPPPPETPQPNGKPPTAESPQPKGKARKSKKKKGEKGNSIDDVFLPKDIDLDSVEMDETEREVEYFKRRRCCNTSLRSIQVLLGFCQTDETTAVNQLVQLQLEESHVRCPLTDPPSPHPPPPPAPPQHEKTLAGSNHPRQPRKHTPPPQPPSPAWSRRCLASSSLLRESGNAGRFESAFSVSLPTVVIQVLSDEWFLLAQSSQCFRYSAVRSSSYEMKHRGHCRARKGWPCPHLFSTKFQLETHHLLLQILHPALRPLPIGALRLKVIRIDEDLVWMCSWSRFLESSSSLLSLAQSLIFSSRRRFSLTTSCCSRALLTGPGPAPGPAPRPARGLDSFSLLHSPFTYSSLPKSYLCHLEFRLSTFCTLRAIPLPLTLQPFQQLLTHPDRGPELGPQLVGLFRQRAAEHCAVGPGPLLFRQRPPEPADLRLLLARFPRTLLQPLDLLRHEMRRANIRGNPGLDPPKSKRRAPYGADLILFTITVSAVSILLSIFTITVCAVSILLSLFTIITVSPSLVFTITVSTCLHHHHSLSSLHHHCLYFSPPFSPSLRSPLIDFYEFTEVILESRDQS
ncbi:hypothetical protein AAFF_G00273260 [Aldrovandia affinis]|uniref:FAM193 C-terminal domain-containing protein n=1 Tax=Aldrovandia affinis TaxID=143900 RepID=A0AAD7SRD0_9TELE|nr:hypothetical protein AAFF_G00273260 [Aldrovandia affinis]